MTGDFQSNSAGGKQRGALPDFDERTGLTGQKLVTLFDWTEADFLRVTEGSPIRRIGHERWLRNVAVAMGNALNAESSANEPARASIRASLVRSSDHPGELVREHVRWALGS
jgi:epoxyqueuosine reductase